MIFAEVAQRTFAGDGFDPADSRRDAAFFQNLDQADLAGLRSVRAAAEFGREVSNFDDADFVAIFFAKQSHGVILVDGYIDRNVFDDLEFFR